ncbi:tetratricopeptide repeat protein [Streptomyces sp. H10-C2]|uniref:tetratricopeptide repeat protein n=1 Tax=unclassified Streptomyces TaxID=2593676 RepID=UPI0024BA13D8|nr:MULTISPECIES: tetratricopeptide repeat protein [unclassified Streptomyces]MDJ0347360.1 tetratricopeptide repeat protein [Streptomyces sp. PH10-H1]MDJ0375570.1 tetratricopeptide repeat protein [Streptomyces sp. H10-C2]
MCHGERLPVVLRLALARCGTLGGGLLALVCLGALVPGGLRLGVRRTSCVLCLLGELHRGCLCALGRVPGLIAPAVCRLDQAVRVHQLVQRAVRDTLTPAQRDDLARIAADALTAAWPAIESDTVLAQALRANTQALTGHAEDALYQPDAHLVLYRTGNSLGETGQVTAARDHFQHLTATTRHHLGPDHPDTLATRHNVAAWRGEAGDAAGAVAALTELLQDRVRVLGPV